MSYEDLSKDKFSKKQWKSNQRRCKVCVADNREVQQLPPSPANNEPDDGKLDYNKVIRVLDSMVINDALLIPGSDEELFKQPPLEDCPICFISMPSKWEGHKYKSCCGKVICNGCLHANKVMMEGVDLCPFCRSPAPSTEDIIIGRNKKRMEAGDAIAIGIFGDYYAHGSHSFPQNTAKALELYARAGKLGCAPAYNNIGYTYMNGVGIGVDKKKAEHYWKQAAMRGDIDSRYNLGLFEKKEGNLDRALKHWMISAGRGESDSLEQIKQLYANENATKEEYAKALRAHQLYLDDVRSDQRDVAAAYDDCYKYY